MTYGSQVVISQLTNRPIGEDGKEAKIPAFLCTLCNAVLNTPVQAIQHYIGKSHSDATTAKGNFQGIKRNVAKNKQNHQESLTKPKQKTPLSCQQCNLTFNSPTSAQQHFAGSKHAENKSKQTETTTESEEPQLICQTCNAMFNSPISAQQHFSGKKHAMTVAEHKAGNFSPSKTNVVDKINGIAAKFSCNICDIQLTSSTQLQQHYGGVRHKMAAGTLKGPPGWWKEQQDLLPKPSKPTGENRPKQTQKSFFCDVCSLSMNSQVQLDQHMSSQKHQENLRQNPKVGGNKVGRGRGRGAKRASPGRADWQQMNAAKKGKFSIPDRSFGNVNNEHVQPPRAWGQGGSNNNRGQVIDRLKNLAGNNHNQQQQQLQQHQQQQQLQQQQQQQHQQQQNFVSNEQPPSHYYTFF